MKKNKIMLFAVAFLSLTLSACNFRAKSSKTSKSDDTKQPFSTTSEHVHKTGAWEQDKDYHWHTCEECKEVLDKEEHKFKQTSETPATYEADGVITFTCEVCGLSHTVKGADKLEHHYATEWTNDKNQHWHVCTDTGYSDLKSEIANHKFGAWIVDADETCTETGHRHRVCETCQYVENETIPAKGHRWASEWTIDQQANCSTSGSKSHHCLDCDAVSDVTVIEPNDVHSPSEAVQENYVAPTCTEKGSYDDVVYCSLCHNRLSSTHHEIAANGHSYGEWIETSHPTAVATGSHYRECSVCHNIDTEVIPVVVCHYYNVENHIYLISVDNEVQKNLTYEGHYFNEDGVMVVTNGLYVLEGKTYLLLENTVQYGFQIFENALYYFSTEGVMVKNATISDYDLTADGVNDAIFFNSDGKGYFEIVTVIYINNIPFSIEGTYVTYHASVSLTIIESDDDLKDANNMKLSGVSIEIARNESLVQNITTDENGQASSQDVYFGDNVLTISLDGYITRTIDLPVYSENIELTVALDRNVSNTLNGRVLIADSDNNYTNNSPLAGATVTLVRTGNYVSIPEPQTTTTDSNGNYTFNGLTAGVYEITVTKEGYIDVFDVVYASADASVTQNVLIEAIDNSNVETGSISGQVRDATKQSLTPIPNITLKLRSGVNVTYGEVVDTVYTDSNGNYAFSNVNPGNYTIQILDERVDAGVKFSSTTLVVKILSGTVLTGQDAALSPVVNGMRIVLTWGSSPSDLDSHTIFNNGTHIYYSNKSVSGYGTLDVDDTSAYGPETTTVTRSDMSFTFYVYNYSGGGDYVLSNSGAVVRVYIGNNETGEEDQYTYSVPYSAGRYWNVFTYRASLGRIIATNSISSSSPSAPAQQN